MSKSKVVIVLLAVLLLASNLWWAFRMLDAGVTHTYMGVSLEDNQVALAQVIAVANEASRVEATRESIVAAASQVETDIDPFEKDGYLWVGRIGLRFSDNGRLQDVVRAWSPP
ncbi:hypothetical protein [Arenimonas donghaensis]|uniref:hypothetical protein n=1 Tax=Arenimonas donghaensis TaxID=375061 RepID=UPI0012680ED2|nr:hypothetical protein [Arenimonas donghaensis]